MTLRTIKLIKIDETTRLFYSWVRLIFLSFLCVWMTGCQFDIYPPEIHLEEPPTEVAYQRIQLKGHVIDKVIDQDVKRDIDKIPASIVTLIISVNDGEAIPIELEDGYFEHWVELKPGDNSIALTASDDSENVTEKTVQVRRISTPIMLSSDDSNGDEVFDDSVVVIGSFETGWEQSDIQVFLDDESIDFTLLDSVNSEYGNLTYKFSVPASLSLGENVFLVRVVTPDGELIRYYRYYYFESKESVDFELALNVDGVYHTNLSQFEIEGSLSTRNRNVQPDFGQVKLLLFNDKEVASVEVLIGDDGKFNYTLPLAVGSNNYAFVAYRNELPIASQGATIHRTSVPIISDLSPAQGASVSGASTISITGLVKTDWPIEYIQLIFESDVVELVTEENGFSFSLENIRLSKGYNSFKFVASTPDGSESFSYQLVYNRRPGNSKYTLKINEGLSISTDTSQYQLTGTILTSKKTKSIEVFAQGQHEQSSTVLYDKDTGDFSVDVSLELGENSFLLFAKRANKIVASTIVVINRTSHAKFDSITPVNNTEFQVEPVTLTGGVITGWPIEQTLLTVNGQAVKLSESTGSYNFLVESLRLEIGENNVELVASTPDGSEHYFHRLIYAPPPDETAPLLTVEPVLSRTQDATVAISGSVSDPEQAFSGLQSVTVSNSQYDNVEFVASVVDGYYQVEVPISYGLNELLVVATDLSNNKSTEAISTTRYAVATLENVFPLNNGIVTEGVVTVSGEVHVPEHIQVERVSVNAWQLKPSLNEDIGGFTFELQDLPLEIGENRFVITASGEHFDTVSTEVVALYQPDDISQFGTPELNVLSPLDGAIVDGESILVSIAASTKTGALHTTINGQTVVEENTVSYTDDGVYHSRIKQLLDFPASDTSLELYIETVDALGQRESKSVTLHHDNQYPEITVDDYLLEPAINAISGTEIVITGSVADDNIASVTLNDIPMELNVSGEPGRYYFQGKLGLELGGNQTANITAYDLAGHEVTESLLFQSAASVAIEPLLPPTDATFLLTADAAPLQVALRTSELPADATVVAWLGSQAPHTLSSTETISSGQLPMPALAGMHKVNFAVVTNDDQVLATATREFELVSEATVELRLDNYEPANLSNTVEPNQTIELYFNQAIEPEKLQVSVLETLHGRTYVNNDEPGTDFMHAKGFVLEEVHRSRESVPVSIDVLPGRTALAIYPQRHFGYNAEVEVEVQYDGQDLQRFRFSIRELPTFISGVVTDSLRQPISGVKVEIPELNRIATTNGDGAYGFGFQEVPGNEIPSGTYTVIANGDLSVEGVGGVHRKINVEAYRRNELARLAAPLMDTTIPFEPIASGDSDARLGNGDIKLDLTDAYVLFDGGFDRGNVHTQLLKMADIQAEIMPEFTPTWAFGIQPRGIEVEGSVSVELQMPKFMGSYDYLPPAGRHMMFVAYNPERDVIEPVGVGQLTDKNSLVSPLPLKLESLDYLGVTWILDEELQALAEKVASGERSLIELVSRITAQVRE